MENKNLTAVESFYQACIEGGLIKESEAHIFISAYKVAKHIEEKQIIDAAIWMPKPFENMEFLPELGQQYYNETYKQ
jgi:hypothetical protein